MQSYPLDILPPNTCPIEVHVIYVPNFYLTKPDSSIKNGFILKNHPPTRKKCAEIILFGVPFPFRILDVNKLIKKPAENKIHKIKIDHV